MPVKDAFTWMFPAAAVAVPLYLLWVLGSLAWQRVRWWLWWRRL